MNRIRTALIGTGYRGCQLIGLLSRMPAFRLVAVADPRPLEGELPIGGLRMYNAGDEDYRRMLSEEQPQLVFVASPWHVQVKQATACIRAGSHVALEIKGGLCIGEYEHLQRVAHEQQRKVFPLENTVFMREIMAVQRMIENGVFGELIHLKGGYRHDLRQLLTSPSGQWRQTFYCRTNADLYPTHGLAPLCLFAGLGHRDRLVRLTARASKARGLATYCEQHGIALPPTDILTGDIVTTQLETAGGLLITLTHDTTLPRPRSLDFEVQGTRGIWQGDTRRIYLEGISPHEAWEDDASYLATYEHPLWNRWGKEALQADLHHKGMDYLMLRSLQAHLEGESIYPTALEDLAQWCSITPYSEISIREHRSVDLA